MKFDILREEQCTVVARPHLPLTHRRLQLMERPRRLRLRLEALLQVHQPLHLVDSHRARQPLNSVASPRVHRQIHLAVSLPWAWVVEVSTSPG
jgi:hypothetical protein